MEPWKDLSTKAIFLNINHIDTDMIIPAQYLTSTKKTGYSEGLFIRLKEQDPKFPLNRYASGERKVLIAGDNFGCGSSREHAVWALLEYGIQCVIAKSFGDIFKANSLKNGLLPIQVSAENYEMLIGLNYDESNLEVSLKNQTVKVKENISFTFKIDPFRKHCLTQGLDDLDYLLNLKNEIENYRSQNKENQYFDTTWAVSKQR